MEWPRVFVSTDIGGSDPDDIQSLVHLLLYADVLDIEGIISSPPGAGRVKDILRVVDAYERDYPALSMHGVYPRPMYLRSIARQGLRHVQNGDTPAAELSDGSRYLIDCALRKDPRPLYVLAWGSLTDVAQAVHYAPEIKSRIRLYAIGAWNTQQDPCARDLLYHGHPDLWFVENNFTFRGMYWGNDAVNAAFAAEHFRGRGALGDIFCRTKIPLKMGDTPSVLYMLSPLLGGVGRWDDPTRPGWGGVFRRTDHGEHYYTDLYDGIEANVPAVAVWREAFLRDWVGRIGRLPRKES